MGWVTGIAVYVLTWWIVLFAVLPWGVRAQEHPEAGTVESAPDRPRLLLKFAVTTAVAGIVWLGIYWLVDSDIISFHDMAQQMPMH